MPELTRQEWLRSRPVNYGRVDPEPIEEAVLDRQADDLRTIVNQSVAALLAKSEQAVEEDPFTDDELADLEVGELPDSLEQVDHEIEQLQMLAALHGLSTGRAAPQGNESEPGGQPVESPQAPEPPAPAG